MKKYITLLILLIITISCKETVEDNNKINFPKSEIVVTNIPKKENVSVYILAGQSNMAGRGFVEPSDTIPNEKLFSVNKNGQLILAKEPLHYYESQLTGLDCGVSFGKTILENNNEDYVLLLPTAVGGSSIQQWIKDSIHRDVPLLSNFKEKVSIGKKYGTIKGILWHQGESDTSNELNIKEYSNRLSYLFNEFRTIVGNNQLPIILGELGGYSKDNESWQKINSAIHSYTQKDSLTSFITTQDLEHKGDYIHFNANGQREMGKRYAQKMNKFIKN
ncbi:sialate O-acetylesterase [Aurantibacter crassamenti]|uniref:sialate O-acetylesterase n=1 Tax=Aurantibacter crassamenti TaxID=1837375 RepID=UPI00193AA83A|nr:sialate O-acetylesterase [Aurantibacter crassamenti]MBM1107268.1 sialate O-acetylesterase [Aurantibacter crassamenti]